MQQQAIIAYFVLQHGYSHFANNTLDMLTKIKVALWRFIYAPLYRIKYWRTRAERKKFRILNSEETIRYIISNKCSICRMGDGEFQMMSHYLNKHTASNYNIDTFQGYNEDLAKQLIEVYRSNSRNCLVCIPYAFKDSSVYKGYERIFFEREWLECKDMLLYLEKGLPTRILGDSCCSRFYMSRKDIKDYPQYVQLLRTIWDGKEIILIEGEKSRLGIGNDLFSNSKSIQRLLCPSTNAFDKYDEILKYVKNNLAKSKLYLIALGHTATVLAYELSKLKFWAIDIGHVDIEYEWYRRKAKTKIAIPDKYVNEVKEGRIVSLLEDKQYISEIINQIK